MPRFKFLISSQDAHLMSKEADLSGLDAAKAYAIEIAVEYLNEVDGSFWKNSDWKLDIMNEDLLIYSSLMLLGFDAPATGIMKVNRQG